jgi:hypothetical protein
MKTHRFTLRFALILTCAAITFAQDPKPKKGEPATRTLQGLVLDAGDQPLPGAVVQLKDMRTLQVRSFYSTPKGEYHFSGLKMDNDYQVKADFSGNTSGPKTISVFDTQKVVTRNLKIEKPEKPEKK